MEMIEVKTAELIGPALDWATAKASETKIDDSRGKELRIDIAPGFQSPWIPSVNWYQGGPLIVQYQVAIIPEAHDGLEGTEMSERWYANVYFNAGEEYTTEHCDTALIAACRAVVGTVFGDTVSVPKELMQ